MRQKKAVPRWCDACLHSVLYGYFKMGQRLGRHSIMYTAIPIAYFRRVLCSTLPLESRGMALGKVFLVVPTFALCAGGTSCMQLLGLKPATPAEQLRTGICCKCRSKWTSMLASTCTILHSTAVLQMDCHKTPMPRDRACHPCASQDPDIP